MTDPNRPPFMAITSTGGYIGRIYWQNSGIHPDFPRWGEIHSVPDSTIKSSLDRWASDFWPIKQIINWRFYEDE